MALFRIETTPERLARMWGLGNKPHLTPFERSQLERLLRKARQTSVVETLNDTGRAKVLWSAPVDEGHSVTDLDFSSDGRWLAIAGKEGTPRVRVE